MVYEVDALDGDMLLFEEMEVVTVEAEPEVLKGSSIFAI